MTLPAQSHHLGRFRAPCDRDQSQRSAPVLQLRTGRSTADFDPRVSRCFQPLRATQFYHDRLFVSHQSRYRLQPRVLQSALVGDARCDGNPRHRERSETWDLRCGPQANPRQSGSGRDARAGSVWPISWHVATCSRCGGRPSTAIRTWTIRGRGCPTGRPFSVWVVDR